MNMTKNIKLSKYNAKKHEQTINAKPDSSKKKECFFHKIFNLISFNVRKNIVKIKYYSLQKK